MTTRKDTQSAYMQDDLRTQWIDKLRIQERDLVKQKAALRDKIKQMLKGGNSVEAGQIMMQLREIDKELQKVNEATNLGINGTPEPWSDDDLKV
jgi:hypothetical protein